MSNQLSINQPIVTLYNNKVTTTSLDIASCFSKQHKNILRTISNLECSPEFTALNFELSTYTDCTGRTLPVYNITRDGFIFLATGFTGKKAAQFKETYIKAFNEMERILLNKPEQLIPHDKIAVSRTNLICLVHHMIWLKEFYFSNDLYNTFKALNSDFGVRMHDHIKDGYSVAWSLKQDLQM